VSGCLSKSAFFDYIYSILNIQNSLFSKKADLEKQYFNSTNVLRPGGNGYYISHIYEPIECTSHFDGNKVHDSLSY